MKFDMQNNRMTIRELYKWAEERCVEDYTIEIQNRDGGCIVDGTDGRVILNIDMGKGVVVL